MSDLLRLAWLAERQTTRPREWLAAFGGSVRIETALGSHAINPRARPCDEQAIRSAHGIADCTARERRWVLVAAILASVIAYIDESVVNVALPAIAENLATCLAVVQWVINAYTLCLAAFLLVVAPPAIGSAADASSSSASPSSPSRPFGAGLLRTSRS